MKSMIKHIGQQLSAHFNQSVEIKSQSQVYGGDINQTFHLNTNLGSFFIKINDGKFQNMFEKEFAGLQKLHQTKTIKIPEPLLFGNCDSKIFLITEFIQKGNPSKNFWQTFAGKLAQVHTHSNNQFGLEDDNYIGSLHQQNNFCKTWSEFYATQRIMPLVKTAFNQQKLNNEEVVQAEKLCERLKDIFPEEKPALVHGDLWSGNFIADETGAPVMYDPAVYYGNREMDIGMSLLFGGFDGSFYDYYNEAFPLQTGWQKRVQICQLYPLLVHLILFGGSYYSKITAIVKGF